MVVLFKKKKNKEVLEGERLVCYIDSNDLGGVLKKIQKKLTIILIYT